MAEPTGKQGCPNCAPLLQQMEQRVAELEAQLASIQAELAKARKNSGNSSRPPSSDIAKPAPAGGSAKGKSKSKRRPGGQPGHQKHKRPPFAEDEIDQFFDHFYEECPDCGGEVLPSPQPPRVIQQVELIEVPIEITEHRGCACFCPHCDKTHQAPLPADVRRGGLTGPRLTSLVGYLKGACHCSFSTIRKFLRDVVRVKISRGQLRRLCAKVGDSLEAAYQELLDLLPGQAVLNVDETGHKNSGQRMWTWCFRASLFSLFKISPSRGSQVLLEVLGQEFNGVLGCDYFSAYRKYMKDCDVSVQFCLAHLIRDVKFLTTHPDRRNRPYGRRVLEALRALFRVIHNRETMSKRQFANELEDAGNALCGQALWRVPAASESQNLAERFRKHGDSYIRFITTPGMEPTNNLAEQAIRFVVIDRKVTQGSRSEAGQRWLERIWTTIATCTRQGRSVFEFLCESVAARFHGRSTPSLVPDSS